MRTKIIETIVEVFLYTCDVCGRTSTHKSDIETCELNHLLNGKTHKWWNEYTPDFYKEAIQLLSESKNQVSIFLSDELGGDPVYIIIPEVDETFWLDVFTYQESALSLCKELGWHVTIK